MNAPASRPDTQERDDVLTLFGEVVEAHKGDFYTIECVAGALRRRVLGKRGGRLVLAHVRVLPGDRVRVEVSPYDTTRGRIVYRYND